MTRKGIFAVQFWNYSCGLMCCHMITVFLQEVYISFCTFRQVRSCKSSVFLLAHVSAAVEWNAEMYIIPKFSVKMVGYDLCKVSVACTIWRIVSVPSFHSTCTWVNNLLFPMIQGCAWCIYISYDSHNKLFISINNIKHLAFIMDISCVFWDVQT